MNKAKLITINQCVNRNVQAMMPLEDQKAEFTDLLNGFLREIKKNEGENEEFQKGVFADFLKGIIPDKRVNISDKIDLAIYNGTSANSTVGVIIEYKKLTNRSEMMSEENLNVKSFRELVAYYLKERIINKNLEVKKGIVSNGYSFFVIDSKELEKYFMRNKRLVQNFEKFEKKQLSGTTTEFLFNSVIAPEIEVAIQRGIKIAHFNLMNFVEKKEARVKVKKNSVTQLYRFFSEENLLNQEILTDSNKLNKGFYDELLYIMGLRERKTGSTKVIDRLQYDKRQPASFVENTLEQLEMKDPRSKDNFERSISLTVVWINRILFLKLLESSLISFNNSEDYRFLNYEKCRSFNDLNDLFFQVMAKKYDDRILRLQKSFPNLPYMNSSLFEESKLEKSAHGITINDLREADISVYSKTKLKDSLGNKLSGQMPILKYLFRFLSAYDFTSSINIKDDKKDQLINASVLGLIFEKINGYKDGSFFTPGKITMYMSRRAIRQIILTRINHVMKWNFDNIVDLGYQLRDYQIVTIEQRKVISNTIDDLKILDPAVGSGHFLVSALNELISIKSALRVLFDSDGKLMNDVRCTVVNDELIIQDDTGNNYSYNAMNPGSLRIQKALFMQKQTIIENCLFGVDLNPNSVNICRLRLWIELLKNSFYSINNSGQRVLTTLPNIDVNIKVGDSLIHRFNLNSKLDSRIPNFKQYLQLVHKYKNTSDKKVKKNINDNINKVKKSFLGKLQTPEGEALERALEKRNEVGQTNFFEKIDEGEFGLLKQKVNDALSEYNKAIKDPIYNGGLEWRMEFPEVLDSNGNFVGFDVVIANPPYIFARNQSFTNEAKKYYSQRYEVSEYQANTYTLFMELGYNLLKKDGVFAYIVPNNMLTIQSNQKIRKFLCANTGNLILINSLDKLFSDANVDNCLVFFQKRDPNNIVVGELKKGEYENIGTVSSKFFGDSPTFSISMVKYKDAIHAFWQMNNYSSIGSSNVAKVRTGIKAYQVNKGKPKMNKDDLKGRVYHSNVRLDDTYLPYIDGNNVNRYNLTWDGEYIKYGDNLAEPRKTTDFSEPRILVRQIPTKGTYSINGAYTDKTVINDLNSMVIEDIKIDPFALLAVINSKPLSLWFLMKFDKFQRRLFPQFKTNELAQFPVPTMDGNSQYKLSELAKIIMKKAQNNSTSIRENKEIDETVMELFNFNESDKQAIRSFDF